MAREVLKGAGFPLEVGRERQVIREVATAAGTQERVFEMYSDTLLVSLHALSVVGTLKVEVFTESSDGQEVRIIEFPELSAATSDILLRKASASMERVIIKITYSDACSYVIRARGTATGESSFKILGANDLRTTKVVLGTTAMIILPSTLTDRATVAIRNYTTTATIEIASTAALLATNDAWPLGPGESVVIDVQAGQDIYGISTEVGTDIRIMETGG